MYVLCTTLRNKKKNSLKVFCASLTYKIILPWPNEICKNILAVYNMYVATLSNIHRRIKFLWMKWEKQTKKKKTHNSFTESKVETKWNKIMKIHLKYIINLNNFFCFCNYLTSKKLIQFTHQQFDVI